MEIGIELHERSHELTNRPVYDTNSKGAVLEEGFSQFPESSAEHSSRKRTVTMFSKLNLSTIYMSTMLYAAILVVESLFQFRLFQRSHSFISFYWLESCVIVFIFTILERKRIESFRSQARHFLPFLVLHVAVMVTFGLDLNQSTFGSSGGSESFCVSLAMTAPLVVLATWTTNRQSYPEKIIIIVSLSCSLLMVLFCGMQDRIANYKTTLLDGAFGFIMASSLAFFTVHGKNNLSKASFTELLYLLNFTSVICLPFFALLFGEIPSLKDEVFKRGVIDMLFGIFVLALLRLASQAACLYQLTHSSPLLNATTRGFAWIWITVGITVITHVNTGELLVPVFLAFWIYGFLNYLPIICSDLHLI
ncbi:uncharacterized protein [Montipora capricornis]|uniref:uncharacterized protein isoform X2 n=1 Tax=Montipora capricornis TaxID=246305 RepID=UPI0035F1A31E